MMNDEEKYLKSKIGNRNPFTVPEGYFEQVTGQIMQNLPAQEPKKPALIMQLRPFLYAAACICFAIFGVSIYLNTQTPETLQLQSSVQEKSIDYNDLFIDEAADYAMFDNEDIYAGLLAEM